jgi:hypothetical protein
VHWLYYQRFPDKAKSDVDELTTAWAVNGEDDLAGETKSINLIRLHLFSDKYQVPQLSKETLDDFFHHLQLEATALAGPKAITEAYNSLDENSPFVRLLVDTQCCTVNSICKVSEQYIWPAGYLWNMIHRYHEIIRQNMPSEYWKLNLCDYHDHKTDEEKDACNNEQKRRERDNQT